MALTVLSIASRVGRNLERQGLLERDAENSDLASDAVDDDLLNHLPGSSITYRIAVGPQAGRKVFTLQTLPDCDPGEQFDTDGKVAGFSLQAGVTARAHERKKLERLCRYITRPGCLRATSVTHAERQHLLPTEDTVARWHHACDFRTTRFHCPAGGPGTQTARQPDALTGGLRTEQQPPCVGHESCSR